MPESIKLRGSIRTSSYEVDTLVGWIKKRWVYIPSVFSSFPQKKRESIGVTFTSMPTINKHGVDWASMPIRRLMLIESPYADFILDAPNSDGPVAAAGCQIRIIRRKGNRKHRAFVFGEGRYTRCIFRTPQFRCSVYASGRNIS